MGFFARPIFAKTPADTFVMAWNLDSIKTFDLAQLNDVYASEILVDVCDNLVDSATDDPAKTVPSLAKS